MSEKPNALGRGLSALISDSRLSILERQDDGKSSASITMLSIESLEPNPDQPRRHIASGELGELADSIAEHGVLQPILVTWIKNNQYQIVAGERRWRAAQIAGLSKIPTIIKNIEKKQALEISIIENIQRQELSPLEEAGAYIRLMEEFLYTQEQLSLRLGKSRSYISNTIRLLKLPENIQDMIADGRLSAGHARALIKSENPLIAAAQVLDNKLNVRQTEALLKHPQSANSHVVKHDPIEEGNIANNTSDIMQLEARIAKALGMKAKIIIKQGKATLIIEATDMNDFDSLIEILCQQ